MDARTVGLIEQGAERVAAAVFGAAAGFGVYGLAAGQLPEGLAIGVGAISLLVTSIACNRLLRLVGAEEPHYELTAFDLPAIESELPQEEPGRDEPLELDDVLAEPSPESRVVRLFDPKAMPTPAQLERIDRLEDRATTVAVPDAAQDLYQALADLRRSLR